MVRYSFLIAPLRHPRDAQRAALLLVTALLSLAVIACQEEAVYRPLEFSPTQRIESGPPRTYQLGFSALPATLTDVAYIEAWDTAAAFGDVLLLQRPPAWADFLPGVVLSDERRDETLAERTAAAQRNLDLMIALDPFDPTDRDQLAALPPGYGGQNLSNQDLRHAFVTEAKHIALNYRPAYLVLGMEVNAAFERDPDGYFAFVRAYSEAYDLVKEASPETIVFASFQYEQLLGLIPWEPPHVPRWELIDDFGDRLDVFAITTYPSFAFSVARKIPPLYYSQITEHTDLPLGLVSVGYSSARSREGLNSSTAAEQRRFLQRLIRDADELSLTLLIWFAARDPEYATAPPLDLLASIGLRTSTDDPKEAWPTWEQLSLRPHDPEAVEVTRAD